jgi:hypothetical protein
MGAAAPPARPVGRCAVTALVAGGLAVGAMVAACGASASPVPSSSATSSALPSVAAEPSVATPGDRPSAAVSSPIPWDDALIGILPPNVDGLVVAPDRETAASLAGDPELAAVARGLVYALAVDPTTDAFALASVVRFEPGVLDDGFYRDWRDSFDEGACSQAGGVAGNAQAEIAGRPTFIGTCAGGLHTYHVAMPEDGIVVSVSSFGEPALGELVIAGLRDPA